MGGSVAFSPCLLSRWCDIRHHTHPSIQSCSYGLPLFTTTAQLFSTVRLFQSLCTHYRLSAARNNSEFSLNNETIFWHTENSQQATSRNQCQMLHSSAFSCPEVEIFPTSNHIWMPHLIICAFDTQTTRLAMIFILIRRPGKHKIYWEEINYIQHNIHIIKKKY